MFFTQEAFDRFNLTKEEFALLEEMEKEKKKEEKKEAEEKPAKKGKKGKNEDAEGKEDEEEEDKIEDLEIDWNNLTERKKRLTIHTSKANDWVLSEDGEKLYYLTRFEKNLDIWVTEFVPKRPSNLPRLVPEGQEWSSPLMGNFCWSMRMERQKR